MDVYSETNSLLPVYAQPPGTPVSRGGFLSQNQHSQTWRRYTCIILEDLATAHNIALNGKDNTSCPTLRDPPLTEHRRKEKSWGLVIKVPSLGYLNIIPNPHQHNAYAFSFGSGVAGNVRKHSILFCATFQSKSCHTPNHLVHLSHPAYQSLDLELQETPSSPSLSHQPSPFPQLHGRRCPSCVRFYI